MALEGQLVTSAACFKDSNVFRILKSTSSWITGLNWALEIFSWVSLDLFCPKWEILYFSRVSFESFKPKLVEQLILILYPNSLSLDFNVWI